MQRALVTRDRDRHPSGLQARSEALGPEAQQVEFGIENVGLGKAGRIGQHGGGERRVGVGDIARDTRAGPGRSWPVATVRVGGETRVGADAVVGDRLEPQIAGRYFEQQAPARRRSGSAATAAAARLPPAEPPPSVITSRRRFRVRQRCRAPNARRGQRRAPRWESGVRGRDDTRPRRRHSSLPTARWRASASTTNSLIEPVVQPPPCNRTWAGTGDCGSELRWVVAANQNGAAVNGDLVVTDLGDVGAGFAEQGEHAVDLVGQPYSPCWRRRRRRNRGRRRPRGAPALRVRGVDGGSASVSSYSVVQFCWSSRGSDGRPRCARVPPRAARVVRSSIVRSRTGSGRRTGIRRCGLACRTRPTGAARCAWRRWRWMSGSATGLACISAQV